MKNRAHGQYSVRVSEQIIIVDYSEGFNLQGVQALTNEILAAAQNLDSWVLYQKPDPTAGVANDAVEEMYLSYLALQKAGCIAVGIINRSIFVRAGDFCKRDEFTLPIFIHDEEEVILNWLKKKITQANKSDAY